jgi:hypothetical protein
MTQSRSPGHWIAVASAEHERCRAWHHAARQGRGRCAASGRATSPIRPLLDQLDFVRGNRNWGWKFRLGSVEIAAGDSACIVHAMGVPWPQISEEPGDDDIRVSNVPRRRGRRRA